MTQNLVVAPGVRHTPETSHACDPFLYEAGRLVVSENGLEEMMKLSIARNIGIDRERCTEIAGTRLLMASIDEGSPGPEDPVLLGLAAAIEAGLGRHDVAPNYALTFGGHANFFPAVPPSKETVADPKPKPAGLAPSTAPTRISVIDVGFDDFGSRTTEMDGELTKASAPPQPPASLKPITGHGEWVGWIISRYLHFSTIYGRSIDTIVDEDRQHGVVTDTAVAEAINEALQDPNGRPSIITLTVGSPVGNGSSMLATNQAVGRAAADVLVVAAVGNDHKPRLIYPAAWPGVLAVGANVRANGGGWAQATFNNTFPTDVDGPGDFDVPFVTATYQVPESAGHTDFEGEARVIGTSFAVAAVAGKVASNWGVYEAAREDQNLSPRNTAKFALQGSDPEFVIDPQRE